MPLGSWLGSKAKSHGSTQSLSALEEPQQLEAALRAVSHIMNDDVDTAEKLLGDAASPFHKLGKGVVVFMRATLGFEQEVMREASDILNDAETSASEHLRKAQRQSPRSSIYPPGAEFSSCIAQAQLMGAIVGVLNESLTESIKGFYKMRKAFVALDAIMEAEKANLGSQSTVASSRTSLVSQSEKLSMEKGPSAAAAAVGSEVPSTTASSSKLAVEEKDLEGGRDNTPLSETDGFFDADEQHEHVATPPVYAGHLEVDGKLQMPPGLQPPPSYATATSSPTTNPRAEPADVPEVSKSLQDLNLTGQASTDPALLGSDSTDIFIHSGANMCYGTLMLVISMIPPAFATLLKIVGFKGDRDRGLAMLWQATKFDNIYGGLAGLIILSYYNGMLGFCDIVPPPGEHGAYPRDNCRALLAEMRSRYPKSHLWLLEEGRMLASERKLEDALSLMTAASASQLKQVEALHWFERSLDLMYAHAYADCAAGFEKCVSLNNWSHGLYYYIAACAHVELYRGALADGDAQQAQASKREAERLLKVVPKHTGKKRFMARQLPFDVFVNRKLAKWEQRRLELKADSVVDAVGVSPIEEVIYFWNGYKRMRPEHLDASLTALARGEAEGDAEALDEKCIRALLRSAALRNLGRVAEAKERLLTEVLCHEWAVFKGGNKDNWTLPAAHYEMAACLWEEWKEASGSGSEKEEDRLRECGSWVEKVAKWGEGYDLDARIGMKVTTAKDTLKRKGVDTVT